MVEPSFGLNTLDSEGGAPASAPSARKSGAEIVAPLSGWLTTLSAIPDPAFAQGLLGSGLAIDPTDESVRAPCDGTVVGVAEAGHAVTVRAECGAEVLIHVGLDSVALAGRGFKLRVRQGEKVKAGSLLLTFDLDFVARHAKSAISPIVLVNAGDEFTIAAMAEPGRVVGSGEFLMRIDRTTAAAAESAGDDDSETGPVAESSIKLPMAAGIHARPAARISECAKQFRATTELCVGTAKANARSPTALMALGARHGDTVAIKSRGPESSRAVDAISDLLAAGAGDDVTAGPGKPLQGERIGVVDPAPEAVEPIEGERRLSGVVAAPGMAAGEIYSFRRRQWSPPRDAKDPAHERERLESALEFVRESLSGQSSEIRAEDKPVADDLRSRILSAHRAILEDEEVLDAAFDLVERGRSAAHAWQSVMQLQAARLRAIDNRRLAERAADFIDLENQVLSLLLGDGADGAESGIPEGAIVIADEWYPSDIEALVAAGAGGVCAARGGPTSHAAILAASMGLPTLVALGTEVLGAPNGAQAILDADAGELHINPPADVVAAARQRLERKKRLRAAACAKAHEACYTADGRRIEVFANIGADSDSTAAVTAGAEGCGLLRTEFLFLKRETPPTEEEQFKRYQAIADGLEGRPLIVRTLDIGGDKPAPYLEFPDEENPALGMRGVRVYSCQDDLITTQLQALLRLEPQDRCAIMVPMITSVAELREIRERCTAIAVRQGRKVPVKLGVMIETPAAAMIADRLAEYADFLSIGSNDLSQYTLAIDRGHATLARQLDALHPAVLRLIATAVEQGGRRGCRIGVCGGLAADASAIPLLVGLGVTELSATISRIAETKAIIRSVSLKECRQLAENTLSLDTASAVRECVRERLPQIRDWL